MRSIEIRRHSYTKKGPGRGKGSHLSAQGIAVARELGAHTGPFDVVLTSLVPRTLETAVAMGYAVDEQLDVLGTMPPEVVEEIGHHDRWRWTDPFTTFAQLATSGGPTGQLSRRQREAWVQAVESVPPAGRVLLISHGRIIELGLVACVPDGDFVAWGAPFQHCEGVRLEYDQGRFTNVQVLRLSHTNGLSS
jgi:broad specificity phosphatase PhoE